MKINDMVGEFSTDGIVSPPVGILNMAPRSRCLSPKITCHVYARLPTSSAGRTAGPDWTLKPVSRFERVSGVRV